MAFRFLDFRVGQSCAFVFAEVADYSPDLSPQKNVWRCAQGTRRDHRKDRDSFQVFEERELEACRAYSFGGKLVGSRAKRMKLLLEKEGANIGK